VQQTLSLGIAPWHYQRHSPRSSLRPAVVLIGLPNSHTAASAVCGFRGELPPSPLPLFRCPPQCAKEVLTTFTPVYMKAFGVALVAQMKGG
jgi:hypothetical protein